MYLLYHRLLEPGAVKWYRCDGLDRTFRPGARIQCLYMAFKQEPPTEAKWSGNRE